MITKPKDFDMSWRIKREITIPTIVQLLFVMVMIIAGWINLEKDLTLIQHDLNRLIASNKELHKTIKSLTKKVQHQEYRLSTLEKDLRQSSIN